jgi:hypothetical protein
MTGDTFVVKARFRVSPDCVLPGGAKGIRISDPRHAKYSHLVDWCGSPGYPSLHRPLDVGPFPVVLWSALAVTLPALALSNLPVRNEPTSVCAEPIRTGNIGGRWPPVHLAPHWRRSLRLSLRPPLPCSKQAYSASVVAPPLWGLSRQNRNQCRSSHRPALSMASAQMNRTGADDGQQDPGH